jgi:hypothetical protein
MMEAIRDTLARYAHYADSGRFEDLAALFAPDGVLEIDEVETLRGRAAILEFLGRARERLRAGAARPYIRHHVSSVVIELEGEDRARAESYFLAITERGPDHWGRYRDRLVLDGGRWLFAHRRVRIDGRREL